MKFESKYEINFHQIACEKFRLQNVDHFIQASIR